MMKIRADTLWLPADWPAPEWIRAGTTTITGGHSVAAYSSLNLASHVGDDIVAVEKNRELMKQVLHLPTSPLWLHQVHGNEIINSDDWQAGISADACYSQRHNAVCAVLTADCLPLLLCDRSGRQIASVHLGWRSICAGLLNRTLDCFSSPTSDILAWIGPHIRARNYQVGDDMRQRCLQSCPGAGQAFSASAESGKWQASLATLVRWQLAERKVNMIYDCEICSYADSLRFYSYRRSPDCGRMASLIWMETAAE